MKREDWGAVLSGLAEALRLSPPIACHVGSNGPLAFLQNECSCLRHWQGCPVCSLLRPTLRLPALVAENGTTRFGIERCLGVIAAVSPRMQIATRH